MIRALLLLIAAAAIALPTWLTWSAPRSQQVAAAASVETVPDDYPSPAPFHGALLVAAHPGQATPDAKQYSVLKRIADRSCRCARSKRGKQYAECWAEFDANAQTFASYKESTTMCMTSITQACFKGRDCLVKDYEGQCSEREAAAAQAVYARAGRHARSKAEREAAFARAEREVGRLAQSWDAGARVADATPVKGCGG